MNEMCVCFLLSRLIDSKLVRSLQNCIVFSVNALKNSVKQGDFTGNGFLVIRMSYEKALQNLICKALD